MKESHLRTKFRSAGKSLLWSPHSRQHSMKEERRRKKVAETENGTSQSDYFFVPFIILLVTLLSLLDSHFPSFFRPQLFSFSFRVPRAHSRWLVESILYFFGRKTLLSHTEAYQLARFPLLTKGQAGMTKVYVFQYETKWNHF